MKPSIQAQFWKFLLKNIFKNNNSTISKRRAQGIFGMKYLSKIPNDGKIELTSIQGINSAWFIPLAANKDKVILYLHGGGYVTGSIVTYQMMCISMSKILKIKFLLPEYRLAPEHPFPAALEDSISIYHWLLEKGYSSQNIIIMGDSAGGGLAIATVLALRDAGEILPAGVICLSPWVDLLLKGKSHSTKVKQEVILRKEHLAEWGACYAAVAQLDDPLISPLYANFQGLPDLLIQVGSDEILLDESISLANCARKDGVHVQLDIWDGMWHVWQVLADLLPENRLATEQIGKFISDHDEG